MGLFLYHTVSALLSNVTSCDASDNFAQHHSLRMILINPNCFFLANDIFIIRLHIEIIIHLDNARAVRSYDCVYRIYGTKHHMKKG